MLTTGRDDHACARETIAWLVRNHFADNDAAAWARAHSEVGQFLRARWVSIRAVAGARYRRAYPGRRVVDADRAETKAARRLAGPRWLGGFGKLPAQIALSGTMPAVTIIW